MYFYQFSLRLVPVIFRKNIDFLINQQNFNETCPSIKHQKRYKISPLIKYLIKKHLLFIFNLHHIKKPFFYYSSIYYFVRVCFPKNIKVTLSERIKINCTNSNVATTNQLKTLITLFHKGKLGFNFGV